MVGVSLKDLAKRKIGVSQRILRLVGVARLELAASWSRTMRATICATPRNSFLIIMTNVTVVKKKSSNLS